MGKDFLVPTVQLNQLASKLTSQPSFSAQQLSKYSNQLKQIKRLQSISNPNRIHFLPIHLPIIIGTWHYPPPRNSHRLTNLHLAKMAMSPHTLQDEQKKREGEMCGVNLFCPCPFSSPASVTGFLFFKIKQKWIRLRGFQQSKKPGKVSEECKGSFRIGRAR